MQNVVSRSLPSRLEERQFNVVGMDKIFASVWLNDSEIVIGTKCNRLFVLNAMTSKKVEIPSIVGHRSAAGWAYGSVPAEALDRPTRNTASYYCGRGNRLLSTQASPTQASGSGNSTEVFQRRDSETFQCCGIHSLAINPSGTMLAVGSGHPTEFIQIYSLPTFEPLAILSGHADMVFSVSWISDSILVSGSRDTTVKLWSLTEENKRFEVTAVNGNPISIFQPLVSKKEHCGKVRDLKFNCNASQTATLSTDGTVKVFDAATLSLAMSVPLVYTNETVCLGLGHAENLYSVGSQSHISLIDPRVGSVVSIIDSCDDGWGVRSVSINNGVITIGGGYGRISFYDVRAQSYITWPERNSLSGTMSRFLQNGSGWLDKDQFYMNHFRGQDIRNAVYTLSYDPLGVRLFSAGGPLQLNLCGSYAAIWE
ncbi:DDB1- and CUL4-associated factor 12 [Phlyctochytrium planicorne]|nr:DDB1- and CUL4-associated factor 12 [Phlyctochytrium planicorne]